MDRKGKDSTTVVDVRNRNFPDKLWLHRLTLTCVFTPSAPRYAPTDLDRWLHSSFV